MKIDKYYMCHYTKLAQRKEYVVGHLERFNLKVEFVDKYDKEDIDYEQTKQIFPQLGEYSPLFGRKITKPEISLCLKHIEVFRDVINNNYSNVIVFEDDICLDDDFNTKLDLYLTQLPEDYDVLWIGSCCDLHATVEPKRYIYEANSSRCTHTYLISNEGCRKMLSQLQHLNHPIDWYFNFVINKLRMNNFWAEPSLSNQKPDFETTIQKNKREVL